jgi:type IV secretion system protein VirB10
VSAPPGGFDPGAPPEPPDGTPRSVRGERATALVSAAHNLQTRIGSVLAAALMIALGVGALSWYYAHALARPARARQAAQALSATRAQAEMSLPSLGQIEPAAIRPVAAAPADLPALPGSELREPSAGAAPVPGGAEAAAPAKTPGELALERRLGGAVFAHDSGGSSTLPVPAAPAAQAADGVQHGAERAAGSLATLLVPTTTTAIQAQRLPGLRFLLPKGAFIDCTLETAIDSTLPGMTTCITATDTFSADGTVVLMERGTKLVGETRGAVQQGQARLFVLWTQARTPAGVIVPLDSPGTDELGRAGLAGEVQRHFWQRFGAAILVSLVDGAVQAAVQSSNRSGGTVVYTPSGSQEVLTEVLKDTISIPPTITKNNGDRIQVLVARDLDFRSVYELRSPVTGH